MAKKPVVIFLGVFAAGEIPYPIVHTYKDKDQQPIDVTGWTTWVEITGPGALTYGTGSIILLDPSNGKVQYTWAEDDFQDIGAYQVLLWVENPGQTVRLASDLVKYEVYDGPGPTPHT